MRSFLCALAMLVILTAGPALASGLPEDAANVPEPTNTPYTFAEQLQTEDAANVPESTNTPYTLVEQLQTEDAANVLESTEAPCATAEPIYAEDALIAWAVYWDMDNAMEELASSTKDLSTLVYFAAYFDENDTLFVPKQIGTLMNYMAMMSGPLPAEYLSFTNDRMIAGGGSILKDASFLWKILGSPDQRREHIDQILATTLGLGLSAIEIDYEGFRNDVPLLQVFLIFVEELYAQTSALGMPLRVVLEPSVPFEALTFPEGPEYVMMCYNLYGTHSGPGPKATPAFLQKLVKGMEAVPGKKSFAIATGGFDWVEGAKATSVTCKDALTLQRLYDADAVRDTESGCLVFQYQDDEGKTREVWYADETTLQLWSDTIREMGMYDINIWRLGGNTPWLN